MTGVQTCALPICFPVTIVEEDIHVWKVLLKEKRKYVTPYLEKHIPHNGIIESKSKSVLANKGEYLFEIYDQSVHSYKDKEVAECEAFFFHYYKGTDYHAFPATIPKGTPYWDNCKGEIAAKKMIINFKN